VNVKPEQLNVKRFSRK